MLSSLVTRLFRGRKTPSKPFDVQAKIKLADEHRMKGELHEAILLYEECLPFDKTNVELLNSLGASYVDVGREAEGREKFELAYSLDDTFIPAVANYAKTLIDNRETGRGLELLEHIHICEPDFSNIYAIYAALCFKMGDTERSRHFYLKGWLGTFDSLRMANAYLFPLSYCGTEEETASEHRFWADTMRDTLLESESSRRAQQAGKDCQILDLPSAMPTGRRIRIGYWSPDLRNHSVRYFFRPLLANHDRRRYEIFLYHDCFASDAQTEAMKADCDHFHDVFLLNDVQLFELMRSHQLDVLVEMAGHTSANRLLLFKNNRFAALQITGIGYPPTTGLSTIDGKLVDRYIANSEVAHHYAEEPVILPSSFWCYDPMGDDEGVLAEAPPVVKNGYITFACVGNIAKITPNVMRLWRQIMAAVPGSRLVLRAINFEDPNAKKALLDRLGNAGFDMARVDLLDAKGGKDFFDSYNEIDIILDTYPFNGGTTTCFSTYMGVPVITLAGTSLISRMGLSAMANLGFQGWVAHTEAEYVERAVTAANDLDFLCTFKRTARASFKSTPLGNGAMFARDFEAACEDFLRRKYASDLNYRNDIPALPAKELMRRAYAVWASANGDGAARILNQCLKLYPDHGGAHLFVAQQLAVQGKYDEAVQYLSERMGAFGSEDLVSAVIVVVRWLTIQERWAEAREWLLRGEGLGIKDPFDAEQLLLYRACLDVRVLDNFPDVTPYVCTEKMRLVIVVPCDDSDYFDAWVMRMGDAWQVPDECSLQFVRCGESSRGRCYQTWLTNGLADVLLIMQRVTEVLCSDFLHSVLSALSEHDVVGLAGATRWTRAHWRADDFGVKVAGFVTEARDAPGLYDVQCLGVANGMVVPGMAVLDGVVLGVRVNRISDPTFDDELASVGWALEEDWSYRVGLTGVRLAVHRGLGVLVREMPKQERSVRYPGLLRLQEKYAFPLFSMDAADSMVLSALAADMSTAVKALRRFAARKM